MPNAETPDDPLLEELRTWGGPAEMSAFEAVMWRAEVDPRLRSTTTSVLLLDRSPDWQRFRAGHEWAVAAIPRFRQRVVEPALGIGNPHWVEDPDFNLDYHLRHISLPAPGSDRQLFDAAQNLAMTPFDRARSPWEATLIDGLEGGRAAYVLKLHHATSDGLGIIQLLSRVLGRSRASMNRAVPQPATRARSVPTASALATRQLRDGLFALPSEAAGTVSSLTRAIGEWARKPDALRKGADYLSSARRMVGSKPAPGSGLFRKRSLSWRFDGMEVPLVDLKAAAKAAQASLNDVFLAALILGFRQYHEALGVTLDRIPIGFPISLRTENDPIGGNKFAGSQYAAPLDEPDPVALIRHIQRFVRDTRAEPALDVMVRLMPVITRLPLAAVTAMTADFTSAQDAQISNIPGISEPVYMAGAEVTHFFPFAPVPGCGMMIVMMSHNGRCCIGVNSDRAAVTEPELLMECFTAGMAAVLALGASGEEAAKPKPARAKRPSRPRKTRT